MYFLLLSLMWLFTLVVRALFATALFLSVPFRGLPRPVFLTADGNFILFCFSSSELSSEVIEDSLGVVLVDPLAR